MTRAGLVALVLAVSAACGGGGTDNVLTVAMMPKNKGNPYFASCRVGAEAAA